MYGNENLRRLIDRMFVPPSDYDSIKVETRESPEEPVLVITLYRNNQVIFFHNYAFESTFLGDEIKPKK
jgi:hypothetical protein